MLSRLSAPSAVEGTVPHNTPVQALVHIPLSRPAGAPCPTEVFGRRVPVSCVQWAAAAAGVDTSDVVM